MSRSVEVKTNYKESRKLLGVLSRGNGPWVPVRRLRRIEVNGGSKDDLIEIQFRKHSLLTDPDPLFIRGGKARELHFPKGQIRFVRHKGRSSLTIMAVCERLHENGPGTIERHRIHRNRPA